MLLITFQSIRQRLKKTKIIKLIDSDQSSNLLISEETINHFIKFVQLQKIPLNNSNVVPLNYLSNLYKVKSLQKLTEKYITKHHDELAIQILLQHQNDSLFDTSTHESIISKKKLALILKMMAY